MLFFTALVMLLSVLVWWHDQHHSWRLP